MYLVRHFVTSAVSTLTATLRYTGISMRSRCARLSPMLWRWTILNQGRKEVETLRSNLNLERSPDVFICARYFNVLGTVEMLKFGKVLGLGENLDLSESLTTPAGI